MGESAGAGCSRQSEIILAEWSLIYFFLSFRVTSDVREQRLFRQEIFFFHLFLSAPPHTTLILHPSVQKTKGLASIIDGRSEEILMSICQRKKKPLPAVCYVCFYVFFSLFPISDSQNKVGEGGGLRSLSFMHRILGQHRLTEA